MDFDLFHMICSKITILKFIKNTFSFMNWLRLVGGNISQKVSPRVSTKSTESFLSFGLFQGFQTMVCSKMSEQKILLRLTLGKARQSI